MSERKCYLGQCIGTTLRVMERRLAKFSSRHDPRRWLAGLVTEVLGLTLFAFGLVSGLLFLSADSPAEAARRGLAKLPVQCEAGYFNHGSYVCWYTIADHPLLFAASIATLVVGASTFAWAHRRWFYRRGGHVS